MRFIKQKVQSDSNFEQLEIPLLFKVFVKSFEGSLYPVVEESQKVKQQEN